MRVDEALTCVLEAVQSASGCEGAPPDLDAIRHYQEDPSGADDDTIFYVGGIPLLHFYAFSAKNFEDEKDELWRRIQDRCNIPNVNAPGNLAADLMLVQLASYIHRKTS